MRETQVYPANRAFSVGDFLSFGQRFGIDYRFPGLRSHRRGLDHQAVARGAVRQWTLASGFRFTLSDLNVLHRYESISLGQSPLLIVIVVDGAISLEVGAYRCELKAGQALSLQLRAGHALHAVQCPGPRLKTVTLALNPATPGQLGAQSPSLAQLLRASPSPVHAWRVPVNLLTTLQQALESEAADLAGQLVLEGLALQLVGHGLPGEPMAMAASRGVSPAEFQRLERIRQQLELAPTDDYSLHQLAGQVAMSPSSLRAKFSRAYGMPVFEYLRHCRLELARSLLQQGFSVQQAAHRSGYRHATNFATAFRKQFGVSPSDIA